MRLSTATLDQLPGDIARPGHTRTGPVGIVHFGIGAFHRAHQAWYTDRAMAAGENGWMIAGVSLRSASVRSQLQPQDGLFTVAERGAAGETSRVVGSVREVLVAGDDRDAIIDRIAARECHLITLTVTEKGYARGADGLLDRKAAEASFYPLLAEGLARRQAAGLPGLTLLSCDNLAENGRKLRALLLQYLPDSIHNWFESECRCPSSMVDRIVPATTEEDLDRIATSLGGLRDDGAVVTEPFSQWVIENRFAGPRPRWENHGAQIVEDVAPYETAKLRMLNGAHSLLAYCGLDAGHTFVHEAIRDPALRTLANRLMREEAATSFTPAAGQDLDAYADALVTRFENPALQHRLIQIAMDGSEKIPQRWLETLEARRLRGQRCPAIMHGLAAWLRHICGDARPVDDPAAQELAGLWQQAGRDGIARALFGPQGRYTQWRASDAELNDLTNQLGGKR